MAKTQVTILSCDPGSANFGIAIHRVTYTRNAKTGAYELDLKLLKNTLIPRTLRSAAKGEFRNGMDNFSEFMGRVMDRFSPEVVCLERFINRGSISGSSAELVGMMVGALYEKVQGEVRSFLLYGASTWKSALKRTGTSTEEIYEALIDKGVKPIVRLTPHQIDAVLIGIYAAHQLARLKGFEFLPAISQLKAMIEKTQVRFPKEKRIAKKKRKKK